MTYELDDYTILFNEDDQGVFGYTLIDPAGEELEQASGWTGQTVLTSGIIADVIAAVDWYIDRQASE